MFFQGIHPIAGAGRVRWLGFNTLSGHQTMARRDPVTEQGVPTEWIGVGERLRGAREAAGISMRELARRVEVSPGHISNVERGLASLSVRSLYTIVSELQISMDSLK